MDVPSARDQRGNTLTAFLPSAATPVDAPGTCSWSSIATAASGNCRPGGRIDPGETPRQAAVREPHEEKRPPHPHPRSRRIRTLQPERHTPRRIRSALHRPRDHPPHNLRPQRRDRGNPLVGLNRPHLPRRPDPRHDPGPASQMSPSDNRAA
ncbi:NUDIX domain-containing protein [Actinomadura sp. 1N219]|uniref:NUDIX domain-containing protein n=1 Tax=Actinomadura sp. 1N219 TaxID=3375152 RepID=UPI003799F06E